MRKIVWIVLLMMGIAGNAYAAQYSLKDCNINIDLPNEWQEANVERRMDGEQAAAYGFMNQERGEMLLISGHPFGDETFFDINQIGKDTELTFIENFVKSNTESLAATGVEQRVLGSRFRNFTAFKALVMTKSWKRDDETFWIRQVDTMKANKWTTLEFVYLFQEEMRNGEEQDFKIVDAVSVIETTKPKPAVESKVKEPSLLSWGTSAAVIAFVVASLAASGYKFLRKRKN